MRRERPVDPHLPAAGGRCLIHRVRQDCSAARPQIPVGLGVIWRQSEAPAARRLATRVMRCAANSRCGGQSADCPGLKLSRLRLSHDPASSWSLIAALGSSHRVAPEPRTETGGHNTLSPWAPRTAGAARAQPCLIAARDVSTRIVQPWSGEGGPRSLSRSIRGYAGSHKK